MNQIPFESLEAFLAMGGYAAYVWPVYVIAVAVLVANLVIPFRTERRILRDIARRLRRERRGMQ